MTFDRILEDGRLWAVRYDGQDDNCFVELFDTQMGKTGLYAHFGFDFRSRLGKTGLYAHFGFDFRSWLGKTGLYAQLRHWFLVHIQASATSGQAY